MQGTRINRYIMECKFLVSDKIGVTLFELIDTLWNVNRNTVINIRFVGFRINRYIMECKYHKNNEISKSRSELIDTLWNVNI